MNEFLSLTFENDKKLMISLDIFTLLTIYYYSYYLPFGFLCSYNIYYIFSAKQTGDYAFGMIKNDYIHIHHWLYCSAFLLLAMYYEELFLIGFFYGGISHGIQYGDWLDIIKL
jgi:hypothetical protein